MHREVTEVRTGGRSAETGCGVTSLRSEAASPKRLLKLNRGNLAGGGQSPHPWLELRRGPEPHKHRSRSREHDPAAALRGRHHRGPRLGRCGDDAQAGPGHAAGARLPEDDRQRPSPSAGPARGSGTAPPAGNRGRHDCPRNTKARSRRGENRDRRATRLRRPTSEEPLMDTECGESGLGTDCAGCSGACVWTLAGVSGIKNQLALLLSAVRLVSYGESL